MKVEVRLKEGNRDRWEILHDGEKWGEVHRTIFGKHPSFPAVASPDQWQPIFDKVEYQRAKGYGIWRLSSQSYHSEQLAKLLRERLVQATTIDRLLTEFKEIGYLNDERWVQLFIQGQSKKYGLRIVLMKLRMKGLSDESLESLAEQWQNPEEELETIRHLLKTKYKNKNLSQFKEKQKVVASLVRKGYTFDQIRLALKNNDS